MLRFLEREKREKTPASVQKANRNMAETDKRQPISTSGHTCKDYLVNLVIIN